MPSRHIDYTKFEQVVIDPSKYYRSAFTAYGDLTRSEAVMAGYKLSRGSGNYCPMPEAPLAKRLWLVCLPEGQ